MASFTSTFPFPASPTQYETIRKYPRAGSKTAFPRLSKPLLYFKRIYSEGKKLERATRGQTPVPHPAGISDLVSLSRGEKGARPALAKHLLLPKILWLAGSRECSLISIPKSQTCRPRGQPCLGKLMSPPHPPLPRVLGQQPTSSSHRPLTQPRT